MEIGGHDVVVPANEVLELVESLGGIAALLGAADLSAGEADQDEYGAAQSDFDLSTAPPSHIDVGAHSMNGPVTASGEPLL